MRREARAFLDAGGVHAPGWRDHALCLHRRFVDDGISPGGSADVVAAMCLVAGLEGARAAPGLGGVDRRQWRSVATMG